MNKFLLDLKEALQKICPTFLHLPLKKTYPYITLEPLHSLHGFPAGPTLLTFNLKVWSQYAGTKEILNLAKMVEVILENFQDAAIKILKSKLILLDDETTRLHTFCLKAKVHSHE